MHTDKRKAFPALLPVLFIIASFIFMSCVTTVRQEAAPGGAASGGPAAEKGSPEKEAAGPAGSQGSAAAEKAEGKGISVIDVSPAELEIIREYVDNLTYIVFRSDLETENTAAAEAAVDEAVRYLRQEGIEYVSPQRITSLNESQAEAWLSETGGEVPMISWIAHKLNAGIYIGISVETAGSPENGEFYGSAKVRFDCYEAVSMSPRGTVEAESDFPQTSSVSAEAAVDKAVRAVAYKGIEDAVDLAVKQSILAASGGFRFTVRLLNPDNPAAVDEFERLLGGRVKSAERTVSTSEACEFEVYLIGNIADLEEEVYEISRGIDGFENLNLVMQRRDVIVFDTGM